MDINQSSLTQYNSNKPDNTRSVSNQKATSDNNKVRESSSSPQVGQQQALKEGQIIKGQIVDHRYNEVRIQLEPGKQIVSAKLSGDIALSIGQEAEFQVTENTPNQLTLKYLPPQAGTPTDSTIMKALTVSGFGITESNKALVAELLNHRMPVDKLTLQTLMKASFQNREASPLTLVLMLKNNIPLTKENINQFIAHQNGTAKLINDINNIAKNISEFVISRNQTSSTTNPTGVSSSIPIGIPSAYQNTMNQTLQMNGKLINILYPQSEDPMLEEQTLNAGKLFSQAELLSLNNALNYDVTQDNVTSKQASSLATSLPSNIVQQLFNSNLSSDNLQSLLSQLANHPDPSVVALVDKLVTTLKEQSSLLTVADVLNPQERASFLESINALPFSQDLKSGIESGTLPTKVLLQELQQTFISSSNTHTEAIKLLQSPEYSKLIEHSFLQRWTLTADKLSQKAPVNELYQNLQEDIEKLTHLTRLDKVIPEVMTSNEPLKNLNENLQFMKDLNEAYTYLQLPMQFKDQQMHSELYVLTNKKAIKENPNQLSVLLHLNMKHLGSLNVHVQMNQNNIQAKFSAEDKEAVGIIEKNIPLLEDVLTQKGYHIHTEVEATYVKPDFTNDFIEQPTVDKIAPRYSFDIRT